MRCVEIAEIALLAKLQIKMADFLLGFHHDVKRLFGVSWDDESVCRIS